MFFSMLKIIKIEEICSYKIGTLSPSITVTKFLKLKSKFIRLRFFMNVLQLTLQNINQENKLV